MSVDQVSIDTGLDPLRTASEAVIRALESASSHAGHVLLDGSEIEADYTILPPDATGQQRRVDSMPLGEDQSQFVRSEN